MGYDYEIQYKPGKDNTVVDALSRVARSEVLHQAISMVDSNLLDTIIAIYATDPNTQAIITKLQQQEVVPNFSWQDRLLRRKGKLVIGANESLRKNLLQWKHASLEAGHAGREQTLRRMKNLFYWKGLTKDVSQFVRKCQTC